MKKLLSSLKGKFEKARYSNDDENTEEYVELNTDVDVEPSSKIIVRPFNLDDFSDVKPILDALREGYTIALVNIKSLKEKDLVELKRAINKLKKTCDAIEGDIAGFGDDFLIVAPSFATIYRANTETIE